MMSLCERFYSVNLIFSPKILTIILNKTNNTQQLDKTTILRPPYLRDKNDCILANIQSHKSSRFLDNVTSLCRHKVSIMRAKTTSNTLQCLQNKLQ